MKTTLYALLTVLLLSSCEGEEAHIVQKSYFTNWTGYDFTCLRTGDIIIKKGRGPLSQKITNLLAEPVRLSHCGIVAKNGDSLIVFHSVAKEVSGIDGVQKVGFNTFLKDCLKGHFYAVRLKDTGIDPSAIVAPAQRYMERGVSFDYKFDHTDSVRMYCSELIHWCLKSATGKDLVQEVRVNEGRLLGFNSLLDTTNFEIVCRY